MIAPMKLASCNPKLVINLLYFATVTESKVLKPFSHFASLFAQLVNTTTVPNSVLEDLLDAL